MAHGGVSEVGKGVGALPHVVPTVVETTAAAGTAVGPTGSGQGCTWCELPAGEGEHCVNGEASQRF
jgi:hypothetical protein